MKNSLKFVVASVVMVFAPLVSAITIPPIQAGAVTFSAGHSSSTQGSSAVPSQSVYSAGGHASVSTASTLSTGLQTNGQLSTQTTRVSTGAGVSGGSQGTGSAGSLSVGIAAGAPAPAPVPAL